jgi:low affinity Fe/Cu permease
MSFNRVFADVANHTAKAAGSPGAFVVCLAVVVLWAVSGPIFQFSDTWQLVINTGTTIVTFLMVFLIQNTQNRDGMAIQAKLDELILTSDAENEFVGIERLTDKELQALQTRCARAADAHVRMAAKAEAVMSARKQKAPPPAKAAKPAEEAGARKPRKRSPARRAAGASRVRESAEDS